MAWYSNVTVFGPRRSPFDKNTTIGDTDGLAWRALVDVVEEGTPASPKWRHLFLENKAWTPALHDQIRLNMPGTSIIRAKVKNVSVFLFGVEFTFALSTECTLLVASLPRDDQGAAQWNIAHSGSDHIITQTPILLCVGGAISVAPTTTGWINPLAGWGIINPVSLVLHASGLAFDGVPKFAWTTAGKPARFNVLFPRPVESRTVNAKLPLLIEPDRQWLFSDFKFGSLDAVAAMKDLRAKFGELDRILRQMDQVPSSKQAQWVQLGVKNPDGPPLFDWLVDPNSPAKMQFRLRRGELSMTLTDQWLGSSGKQAPNDKIALPRTTATVDGDVSIVSAGTNSDPAAFRIEMQAVRELSVASPDPGAALLKGWVGFLSFDQPETERTQGNDKSGRLRWFLGREMSKSHATALRADFAGADEKVIDALESLIAAATVHVKTPVTITFPSSLANRVEIRGQTLSWFGVGIHRTGSLLAVEDPEYTQLKALRDAATGPKKEVLSELCRQIEAIITYENSTAEASETVEWQALDTTYDANDVAAFLRDVQGLQRPDPDEISPGGVVGSYQVEPPVLWGTSPLETGWVTLPYLNVTEELYLRVIEPEIPEPESALINGAAIWGNDDPRLWFDASDPNMSSVLSDQQRWSLTLLDADLVRGTWAFVSQNGQITLKESRVRFYQPEVVFGGMLWMARQAPTLQDSLPDPSSWPNLLHSFSLRSLRTKESFPSPYLISFPEGKITRIEAPKLTPINSYARLDQWAIRVESNKRPVTIPTPIPRTEEILSLTTMFPFTPESTDGLSLVRRIRWPANLPITSQAIQTAKFYTDAADHPRDFIRAARRFRQQIEALGQGNSSPQDIVEEFVFTDGSQPLSTSLPDPLLETVLLWKGGRLDEASKQLLAEWEQIPTYMAAVRRLRARITIHVDESRAIFEAIVNHPFWNHGMENLPSPLIWQRHPTLPFIQSLPLTQSLNPPASPSSSRQLAPFDLTYGPNPPSPSSWDFGVAPSPNVNAARQWGTWLGATLQPANEWKNARFDGQRFLPMVSLSLPGLTAHPTTDPKIAPVEDSKSLGLRLQWFHGLPYLDEKYALAQLPREEGLANAPIGTSGTVPSPLDNRTGDQAGAKVPTPLKRETFGHAWSELSELARLAAVDAASALSFVADGKQSMPSLIEPFIWNVETKLTDVNFPGTLLFRGLSTGSLSLELSEPISDSAAKTPPLSPEKHSALRGIQGSFDVPSGNTLRLVPFDASKTQFDIVAGTLRAKLDADRLRDQRGLFRSPTLSSPRWLRTQVDDLKTPVVLWSSLMTIGLDLGAFGGWNLWLNNLPIEKTEDGPPEKGSFRSQRSAESEDVNDPFAQGFQQGHRQGYEWRMSGGEAGNGGHLFLGSMPFFPLVLKRVETSGDDVTKVEITGRLQLRLATQQVQKDATAIAERVHESNSVRLTFDASFGKLKLTSIAIEPPDNLFGGETAELFWPMKEAPGAPALRIAGPIEFTTAGTLTLKNVRLDFSLLGVRWMPTVQPIVIPINTPSVPLTFAPLSVVTTAVAIDAVKATLEMQSGEHSLAVVLRGIWGESSGTFVKALKTLELLPSPRAEIDGILVSKNNLLKLNKIEFAGTIDQQEVLNPAIQMTWAGFIPATAQDVALFVLPGFGLSRELAENSTPGYASIEFTIVSTDPQNAPTFERIVGVSELVFTCSWGKSLQEFDPADLVWDRTKRAFGSSSGSVSVGLLVQVNQQNTVQISMQLNGLIEIKNLTSWPVPTLAESSPDNAQSTLSKFTNDLSHWRHTARVLLNQVEVPFDFLGSVDSPAGEPFTMFGFNGDKPFQFLAVVEHQVAELDMLPVSTTDPATVRGVPREFRWTVTQEVRLAAPNTLAAFWRRFLPTAPLETPRTINTTQDRQGLISPVRNVALGWLREGLLKTMLGADRDGLPKLAPTTVVVEMSAAFYLPRAVPEALPGNAGNFANVQILPCEIDQAIPISLDDLIAPTDLGNNDREPWSLAVVPFVGRIQPETRDGLSTAGTIDFSSPATLCIDPVLWLTQSLANRPRYLSDLTSRLEQNTTVTLAPFDRILEQKWSSLDPASLEAGLFRIMTPPPETVGNNSSGLTSIMTAAPSNGLSRLSRPVALLQSFDSDLLAYPPKSQQLANRPMDDWQWRYGALFVLQARIVGTTPTITNLDASFFAVGKRLAQVLRGGKNPTGLVRLPGLTVLPPQLDQAEARFSQNISFLTSPYLAIRRLPLPETEEQPVLKVVVADLVVASQGIVDTSVDSRRTSVVASQLWQPRYREESQTVVPIPMPDDDEIAAWADMSRRGLANDSLVAIVRIREVSEAAVSKTPILKFRFRSLARANPIPLLPPLTRAIRPELGSLRAREGQFGGTVMPIDFSAIAFAPPQVDDVEPIHFEIPPAISDPKLNEILQWNWGYSGIRFSLNYADDRIGQAGPPLNEQPAWQKLTWMTSPHPVQFSEEKVGSTKILPKNFRAAAIRGLLPAPPGVPCPEAAELLAAVGETSGDRALKEQPWQPVFPGDQQMFLIGGRPGAYAAVLPQLLTQTESTIYQWTFNTGWAVGDKAIVISGGSKLTVAAASTVIPDIIDQIVAAIAAATEFVHLQPQRVGEILRISFKPSVQASESLDKLTVDIHADKSDGTNASTLLTASQQKIRAAVTSGSIPIQHRWPRPVHIPANQADMPNDAAQIAALAPWGSWFDLNAGEPNDRSVDVRLNPHDAPFVMNGDEAYGLDVELKPLVDGECGQLSDRWPSPFQVTILLTSRPAGSIDVWMNLTKETLKLTLRSETAVVPFDCSDDTIATKRDFRPSDADALREMIQSTAHGDPLWFELRVEVKHFGFGIKGPPVTATLPVRRIHSKELPLPYVSNFCLFEDPEYSRRLASPTTRRSKSVPKVGFTNTEEVTLALDRQEYNPSTKFFLTIDLKEPAIKFNLKVRRISVLGLENLIRPNLATPNAEVALIDSKVIIDLQFGTKIQSNGNSLCFNAVLNPGDRLEFEIKANSGLDGKVPIVAAVQIVRDPVTPPPESAYALLRQLDAATSSPVECVRFAWSPAAQRIEFVDPADLLRESVRRRAVFFWQDTIRPGRTPRYGVQKIMASGSTLIPKLLAQ